MDVINPIHVMVVDDHAILRSGLAAMIEKTISTPRLFCLHYIMILVLQEKPLKPAHSVMS